VPPPATIRRCVVVAVLVTTALLVPLALLRWYQDRRVTALLASYVAASTADLPLASVAPGQLRLPGDPDARPVSAVERIAALGRATARLVEVVVDRPQCLDGTTVTFRYDPAYPETDFSRTVLLAATRGAAGSTRLFEPVYAGFTGLDVSDPSPACLRRVAVVNDLDRFPLLLSAQLPPGWESQPQHQRIAHFR